MLSCGSSTCRYAPSVHWKGLEFSHPLHHARIALAVRRTAHFDWDVGCSTAAPLPAPVWLGSMLRHSAALVPCWS